jgi:PTH1 family peptidyl-tRNA hydrolase
MKLVVGLGNPGEKYGKTRHNVGFMIVDALACQAGARFSKAKGALVAEARRDDQSLLLVKSQLFMNNTGETLRRLKRERFLAPPDIIVVHDDMDLAFGRLRIRTGGASGGHRGVASAIEGIEAQDFFRLKVGIGRPTEGEDPTDFVLSHFTSQERAALPLILEDAVEALWCLVLRGPIHAMNRYNTKAGEKDARGDCLE